MKCVTRDLLSSNRDLREHRYSDTRDSPTVLNELLRFGPAYHLQSVRFRNLNFVNRRFIYGRKLNFGAFYKFFVRFG